MEAMAIELLTKISTQAPVVAVMGFFIYLLVRYFLKKNNEERKYDQELIEKKDTAIKEILANYNAKAEESYLRHEENIKQIHDLQERQIQIIAAYSEKANSEAQKVFREAIEDIVKENRRMQDIMIDMKESLTGIKSILLSKGGGNANGTID